MGAREHSTQKRALRVCHSVVRDSITNTSDLDYLLHFRASRELVVSASPGVHGLGTWIEGFKTCCRLPLCVHPHP